MFLRAVLPFGAVLLPAASALAEPSRPTVQLTYLRAPGTTCPDEQALHEAVLRQAGYDPFRPTAALQLTTAIVRRDRRLAAVMELRDETGRLLRESKSLEVQSNCRTLVDAMGLVIAGWLDSEPAPRPASSPRPALPPVPVPPSCPEPPRAPSRPEVLLGGGVLLGLNVPLSAAVGVSLLAGVRWPQVSLSFEGRAVLPGFEAEQGPRIDVSRFSAMLAPCGHYRFLFGCGLVEIGARWLSGRDAPPDSGLRFLAGVGVRGGVEVRPTQRLVLRVHGDAIGTMTRLSFAVPGQRLWIAPELVAALGIQIAGSL